MRAFSGTWLPGTSGHVTNTAVTPFDAHATRKLHGSVFYRTELLPIKVLHCGNRDFRRFFCSCDLDWFNLHIRTWPVFSGDLPDVRIWTSHVEAFKSCHLTDRQTDRHGQNYIPVTGGEKEPSREVLLSCCVCVLEWPKWWTSPQGPL